MASARLRDVAERARVSIRTVSNVVNGYAPVSDVLRMRVDAAVLELGYRPNVLARNLKRGRSGMLALVVPELDVAYFSELARAVITYARPLGYTVVIDQTDGDAERERELVTSDSGSALFDGVILSPQAITHEQLTATQSSTPVVLLGEKISGGSFDCVAIDNVGAAGEAVNHLFSLGRQRVAAIGDQPYDGGETAQLRTAGYRAAHAAAGRPIDESLIVPATHFHRHDGAAAMQYLLTASGPRPDAVFCYSDLLALGAMRTLLSQGLRVPEDVAIIGFDDIEDGEYHTPSLTTISPDKAQIAQVAVDSLVHRIDSGPDHHPVQLRARHALVMRESTIGR